MVPEYTTGFLQRRRHLQMHTVKGGLHSPGSMSTKNSTSGPGWSSLTKKRSDPLIMDENMCGGWIIPGIV